VGGDGMMAKKLRYTITLDGTYNSRHTPYSVTVHVEACGPTRQAQQVALAAREVMDAVLAHGKPPKSE